MRWRERARKLGVKISSHISMTPDGERSEVSVVN